MSSLNRFEQDLPAVLADLYIAGTPDYRDDLIRRLNGVSQRPAWRIPGRWLPMDLAIRRAPAPSTLVHTGWLLALVAILAALAVAALIGTRQRLPDPFGLAANGVLMYSDGGDIYSRATLEVAPRLVIGGPADEQVVGFSRQGTQILFIRVGSGKNPSSLWVADPNGSNQRRLDGEYRLLNGVDWSPLGDLVAVGHQPRGVGLITLVPTDGTPATTLDLGFEATEPSWRPPDGRQLSFRGKDEHGWSQFVVDRDGTGLRRLSLASEGMFETEYDARGARWSADGERLMYESLHNVAAGNNSGLRIHIAEVGPDASVLADVRYDFEASADDELNARWLPGEDRVVYQRRLGNEAEGIADSLRVAVLGSNPTSTDLGIESTLGDGIGYELSPDGTTILSIAWAEGITYVTDLRELTTTEAPFSTDEGATWQRVSVP